ncbi:hypothetical protein ONZ45_g4627 [Pleurotus djamor]|nr:hypothetical protein ONZ45_g4627 [Pleurotus djamor]
MKYLLPVIILPFFTLVSSQDTGLGQVRAAFANANIPEDLSITFNPSTLLEVSLPQASGSPITLHAGVQLPRDSTAGPPSFSLVGTTSRGPFVIAAVDPDAPTPQTPTASQIRHFLGGNFFKTGLGNAILNTTAAVSGFLQPTPPAGSPAHRYVFLVFNQPPGFDTQTIVTPSTSISLFNISSFAEQVGLGAPIGGTFMLVAPNA